MMMQPCDEQPLLFASAEEDGIFVSMVSIEAKKDDSTSGDDCRGHFARVGEYLREARGRSDRRYVDVEIVVDQQRDLLHSVLGYVHSRFIRNMMHSQCPPFRIKMDGYSFKAVTAVIDWMYFGIIELSLREIGDYLHVTKALGVDKLHAQIETRLRQLAADSGSLVSCINIATAKRSAVTKWSRLRLLQLFARSQNGLSMGDIQALKLRALNALLACKSMNLGEKVELINLAVIWLRDPINRHHSNAILETIFLPDKPPRETCELIEALKIKFGNGSSDELNTLHVYIDQKTKKVKVSRNPEKFLRRGQVIVPSLSEMSDETNVVVCVGGPPPKEFDQTDKGRATTVPSEVDRNLMHTAKAVSSSGSPNNNGKDSAVGRKNEVKDKRSSVTESTRSSDRGRNLRDRYAHTGKKDSSRSLTHSERFGD
ncbi:hypothetical protein AB6A40_000943 [Gnathostoma spinigerum]|uniref:BTB domain-containing protein n=1 Tax=Gnathostoma spinigerum TaxID=75299 RepID=A0ABD6E328_9BILA